MISRTSQASIGSGHSVSKSRALSAMPRGVQGRCPPPPIGNEQNLRCPEPRSTAFCRLQAQYKATRRRRREVHQPGGPLAMNETSVCLPCVSGILYENNELEEGESMFSKARLPRTPPSLYKRPALFRGKQRRSWGMCLGLGEFRHLGLTSQGLGGGRKVRSPTRTWDFRP